MRTPQLIPLLAALSLLWIAPLSTAHASSIARPGSTLSVAAQGTPAATANTDGWATVEQILGPERLQVRNAAGESLRVVHLGVIGPAEFQGENWYRRATDMHAQLLKPGMRVWLELQPGAQSDPRGRWVYRHVYRENSPEEPVGAELLRSGMAWVFPHTSHAYIPTFASDQAQVVNARAGLWAETQSSAVFQPEGTTYGGFPIEPRVLPALKALDSVASGKEVLAAVNDFPVEIGFSPRPRGVLGTFEFRTYSIQMAEAILDAPTESVAAVLIHELTHAQQMINAGVQETDLGCYDMEIQAFEATAKYWAELHGPNGKRGASHWLDATLNQNLRDYNNKRLAQNVRRAYGHECGGAEESQPMVEAA